MPALSRVSLFALALCLTVPRVCGQEQPPPATLADLQNRLAQIVQQPKYRAALWGVKIASLDTGKTLFENNAEKLFSPASNSKLYTVALAMERLGPDYRIRTSLYAQPHSIQDGVLRGDLIVFGRGDPTFNARRNGGDVLKALEPLASALTNAGIQRISGDLVGDSSYFRGPEYGSGWAWDDAENYYGAEISSLTINDNVLSISILPGDAVSKPGNLLLSPSNSLVLMSNRTVTVAKDSRRRIDLYRPLGENVIYVSGQIPLGDKGYEGDMPIHDPARLWIDLFEEVLAKDGVQVGGKLRTVDWMDRQAAPLDPGNLTELASAESPPLRELAKEILKPSQNLYTDLLLAHIGESSRTNGDPAETTSEELGVRELNRFLAEVGVKPGETFFEEGSGLSRDNLVTPNATVALLQYMSRRGCSKDYIEALPVAGVDGTLRNRMKGTSAAGNVRAKTGSLRWASSLSGYVTSAAGEHLVFSLMVNRYQAGRGGGSARADLDRIAELLAKFAGRSEPQ